MSPQEVAAFVSEQRVVVCASHGPRGWPHVMPLWYIVRDEDIWTWTYAKSQKARNLERDPRATLQIEAGEQYQELRGVMIEVQTTIHRATDGVAEVGAAILERYGSGALGNEFTDVIRAQAAKRVALKFSAQRIASWDHRKLDGIY